MSVEMKDRIDESLMEIDRSKLIPNCIIRFCDHRMIVNTKDDSDEGYRIKE